MLHQVIAYARRKDLMGLPGFKIKPVRWQIEFAADGRFLAVVPLGDVENPRNRGENLQVPNLELGELKRAGSGARHFLVDNAAVVTLLGVDEDDAKLYAKHEYFVDLLRDASEVEAGLAPIAASLADPGVLQAIREELETLEARPTENVTFAVRRSGEVERFVERTIWHDWWQSFRSDLQPEGSGLEMRCLLSGELTEPVPTHPKIKGLNDVGGLPMGTVLPAFKQEAFRSYGLEQAANAAMSEAMAAAYPAALNQLIRNHSKTLAGNKFVYWYRDTVEEDPMEWLERDWEADEATALARARKMLEGIRSGDRPDLRDNRYYVLNLSANSSRVVVRDWMEGSFESLVAHIESWFDGLQIVSRNGSGFAKEPKMWAVLGAMVRDLEDLHAPLVAGIWRAAVHGGPIPREALARALQRFRIAVITNDPVRTAGVGLIKAHLCRLKETYKKELRPMLNPDHSNPAYQCGRLLAVLDYLQYRALGDVGAGVVQRFYGAASTTPALVLGRLLHQAQHHLNKLDSKAERMGHENRIAQVVNQLPDELPRSLSLEEQGLFGLGYYQQKAHRPDRSAATHTDTDTDDDSSQETA